MADQASPPQTPPPKPSLLQRLRRLWARPRSGDVIVANVGQGASDVVVGKNILKIGTLVIPALPVVIALIVALVGGAAGVVGLPRARHHAAGCFQCRRRGIQPDR